jgi:hypothetical protein
MMLSHAVRTKLVTTQILFTKFKYDCALNSKNFPSLNGRTYVCSKTFESLPVRGLNITVLKGLYVIFPKVIYV